MTQKLRLMKRTVDAIAPTEKRFLIWDDGLAGFGLRVEPSGVKTFFVRYRAGSGGRSGRQRSMTLGRYGAITPEEARREAAAVLGSVIRGGDPAGERGAYRRTMTVAELCDLYIDEGLLEPTRRGTVMKPSSAMAIRTAIKAHIVPLIGSTRIVDVRRSDVTKLMVDIAGGKTAKPPQNDGKARIGRSVRGGQGVARRVVENLSAIFAFAVRREILDRNPCHGVQKFASRKCERYLTTGELDRLGAALREAETSGIVWQPAPTKRVKHAPIDPEKRRVFLDRYAAAAIRLLILTGARSSEILGLEWVNVDFDRGVVLLPDSKTGRRYLILNSAALAIIGDLPRVGRFVIAGLGDDTARHDLKRPWGMVCKRSGLEGVRVHDLRHTHASFGVAAGFGLPVVGKLLGHASEATTARYAHLSDDPARRASEQIGRTLTGALAGARSPPASSLPRRLQRA